MQPHNHDDLEPFRLLGELSDVQTMAVGKRIRVLEPLHWYEATGVGRRELKIKRYLDV